MVNSLSQQAGRASWTLFQGLFIIAALVAVFVTFVAISGTDPDDPGAGLTRWLLILNFFIVAALFVIVVREYVVIRGRGVKSKARLARRFVLLFGLSALVPTIVVAGILGFTITRGLDAWVGERVDTIMERTASVSQNYIERFSEDFEADARLVALDIETFDKEVTASIAASPNAGQEEIAASLNDEYAARFQAGLKETLAVRNMLTIAILGPDGRAILANEFHQVPVFIPPPQSAFEDADNGKVGSTLNQSRGVVTAVVKISNPVDGYIYTVKAFDRNVATQLREAEAALAQYRAAKDKGGRLQQTFLIGYAQIASLIILLSTRLGLEAAGRITDPIGRLANAAMTVRDGDLSVRVPASGPEDEVRILTDSFNTMTEQLSEQRSALVRAREDAESRRQFMETLLAEVSAGVIRCDPNLKVTLANRSASDVLGLENIVSGQTLHAIAPAFAPFVQETFVRQKSVDATIDLKTEKGMKSIRLKTALDATDGCVLTFDDTTRLVNAQRQMAWRDVARRIAHEIRNPLTPIMLSTERLRRRYGGKLNGEDDVFDRCTETILRQVGDIGRMVEEFSNFARMPKPSVSPFDIVALLNGAAFSQGMVSPDVAISVEAEDPKILFEGDERLLAQAFGNLVKNSAEAFDTLPEDNETLRSVNIRIKNLQNSIAIEIVDSGPGFPNDTPEDLLEPYVTNRENGTGLGLAIVNRIIMDHGGTVTLRNRQDGLSGAHVRVELPKTEATLSTPIEDASKSSVPLSRAQEMSIGT